MVYHERHGKGNRGKGMPSHPQPRRNRTTNWKRKRIADNPPQSRTLKVMRNIVNQWVRTIRENLGLVVTINHSTPKDAGEEVAFMVSVRCGPGVNQGLKTCHPHKRLASFKGPDEFLGRIRRGGGTMDTTPQGVSKKICSGRGGTNLLCWW